MADVRLKHMTFRGETTFPFYDGELKVVSGVITIPSGRYEWFSKAYQRGFRLDPETDLEVNLPEVTAKISA